MFISFSPLSEHDDPGLAAAPLAQGEEFVDNAPGLAHQLLGAELQLLVPLVHGRLRLPEVLNGRRVQGVKRGQPTDKVLKLI